MDKLHFAYAAPRPIAHGIIMALMYRWVIGYRHHPVLREWWKYVHVQDRARP